jgi:hypothetical protein
LTDTRLIQSWINPKARKGDGSSIEGRGVHATEPISRGEIVAIKGGHITDAATVANLPESIRNSGFPIAENLFLAALDPSEYEGVMMLVNHSCSPNVGMAGNVLLVTMKDVAAGDELTIDYALFLGDPDFAMRCQCGTNTCRELITGSDWMREDLRSSYEGWFSWWIQQKINASNGPGHGQPG